MKREEQQLRKILEDEMNVEKTRLEIKIKEMQEALRIKE